MKYNIDPLSLSTQDLKNQISLFLKEKNIDVKEQPLLSNYIRNKYILQKNKVPSLIMVSYKKHEVHNNYYDERYSQFIKFISNKIERKKYKKVILYTKAVFKILCK